MLALQGQLNVLRSHGMDPVPGVLTLVNHFPGIIIDTGGAQDNNGKVDTRIYRIKELCRSIKESPLWQLPQW